MKKILCIQCYTGMSTAERNTIVDSALGTTELKCDRCLLVSNRNYECEYFDPKRMVKRFICYSCYQVRGESLIKATFLEGVSADPPFKCESCGNGVSEGYDCVLPGSRTENVNHPSHYGGKDNPYEAIKVIEAWELDFHLGNTVKYIARAGKKHDDLLEDLEKARWYLDRKIENLKKENTE